MGRPIKTGLTYFPMDVNIDDNLELLEAEHGLVGFAIIVKIWQKIYSNGYYIEWDDDNVLLFSKRINTEIITVNSVINTCFKRNLLDKKMFEKYKILTSTGIQKRYFEACRASKRINITAIEQYLLVNSEFTGVISELTQINSEFSTQSKVKEIKEKENTNIPTELEFLEYSKTICQELKKEFRNYEFSLKAKYEAWTNNNWKDGNNKQIKNWKSKLKNTFPHLKPIYADNKQETQTSYRTVN